MILSFLAVSWLAYFVLHSVLASLRMKHYVADRWSGFMPYYRLTFNLIAMGLVTVPLYLTFLVPGEPLWAWQGGFFWLANGLALLATLAFFYSLKAYDGAEFLGLRQLRDQETKVEDQEHFCLSFFHHYVRHPWYFFALVLIWTRDMPPGMLLTAIMATAYFYLGSRLEETKLLAYYGEAYRKYQRLVPGIIPMPHRFLNAEQAAELQQKANQ